MNAAALETTANCWLPMTPFMSRSAIHSATIVTNTVAASTSTMTTPASLALSLEGRTRASVIAMGLHRKTVSLKYCTHCC